MTCCRAAITGGSHTERCILRRRANTLSPAGLFFPATVGEGAEQSEWKKTPVGAGEYFPGAWLKGEGDRRFWVVGQDGNRAVSIGYLMESLITPDEGEKAYSSGLAAGGLAARTRSTTGAYTATASDEYILSLRVAARLIEAADKISGLTADGFKASATSATASSGVASGAKPRARWGSAC